MGGRAGVGEGKGGGGGAVSVGGTRVAVNVAVRVGVSVVIMSFRTGRPATNPTTHSTAITTMAPIISQNQAGRCGFSAR